MYNIFSKTTLVATDTIYFFLSVVIYAGAPTLFTKNLDKPQTVV